ncbi:vacuolar calcium ion transporter [Podospora didyma]|uniref:Vacuolar calcium ion transporter n=1 Tax=Podospora didyma TaxID=330526 RepID=A0AAE0P4N8_9PEZI|nr:vacuolar calcium ion transporter [Podospora didyma]
METLPSNKNILLTLFLDRVKAWAREKAREKGHTGTSSSPLASRSNSQAPGPRISDARRTPSVPVAGQAVPEKSIPLTDVPEPTVTKPAKKNVAVRFFETLKLIIFSSYINVLLVFVPVGIAVHFAKLPGGIVFAMNAIAIIPLAGLLSYATESVARRMGDTIGALMNVTFGNAVELIIFIIALVKDEIRIVQASLVGSILANLLLILGMCFLCGGLRYREQIYNSTVTQMSACLLSLSVTSLLLPTAFHASFSDTATADDKVLKVSRGTSVILLLVYGLYLLFQLNSHSYMYESTPQHIIERESRPGPAAAYFNSSSSSESDSSSSSSSSDSDDSAHSTTTAKKIKRMVRRKRGRANTASSGHGVASGSGSTPDEATAATDGILPASTNKGDGAAEITEPVVKQSKKDRKKQKKHRGRKAEPEQPTAVPHDQDDARRVDFALSPALEAQGETRPRPPFSLLSFRSPIPNVFTSRPFNPADMGEESSIRRATSMPTERQNQAYRAAPRGVVPPVVPIIVADAPETAGEEPEEEETSRTTAVLLLLISTGLVAICAEFMVDSINEVVSGDSGVSEAFIGLIVLPIVGNAAEHVTAVSVAFKNKMDLALGVALGSSIQIALFITPLVVIIGWCMDKDMSLFFTLFETICMFVSAFIVNFLVLDGRSNYLEGALLCSAYVIIAVAAFFYPDVAAANAIGGGADTPVAG